MNSRSPLAPRSARLLLPSLGLALASPAGVSAQSASPDQEPASVETLVAGTPSRSFRGTRRDVQLNQFTASTQDSVALSATADGGHVATWQSRRQEGGGYGIFARLLDANGAPIGDEIHVNANAHSMQTAPTVAVAADGGVWFAWESFGHDGEMGAIVARKFDGGFTGATSEVLVNGQKAGHQSSPVMAASDDGGAWVVWTSESLDGSEAEVRLRKLDALGQPVGESLRLDTSEGPDKRQPCLLVEGAAGVRVVWSEGDASEAGRSRIVQRRVHGDGTLASPIEVLVGGEGALIPGETPIEPAVAGLADGGLLLAWLEWSGNGHDLFQARVDADGAAHRWAEPLGAAEGCYISGHAVAAAADGSGVLSWSEYGDGGVALHAQRFGTDGAPVGAAFLAAETAEGRQAITPARGTQRLDVDEKGRIAVAWSGDAGAGDSSAAAVSYLWAEGHGPLAPSGASDAVATANSGEQHFADPGEGARPHDPPTFDPTLVVDRSQLGLVDTDSGFTGVVSTGWTPPDPELAVGPNHVLMVTNGAIAWYSKSGTPQFQDEIEGSGGFWGNQGATGFVFDPEAFYDPHHDRFWAMANERGSDGDPYFLLAVSDDSNPNGSWEKYRFNVLSEAGDTDIDSPNFAVDATTVYLTADFFGPDKFLVFTVDKNDVMNGVGTPQTASRVINGDQSFGIPVTYGTPPAQYMIEAKESSSNTTVELWAITNPLTTVDVTSTIVTVPTYQQPEDPPQLGTSVRPETFESRFWSCVYRNGSLWATHHVNGSRVRQRWYEFDMGNWPVSGSPSLVQWGEVDPGGDVRTFFGSIFVNDQSDVALTVARSSPSERFSVAMTTRKSGDPAGQTEPLQIYRDSTQPDTTGRWGDYSGTHSDPADPNAFWGVHEYRQGGIWRTWIQRVSVAPDAPVAYCTAKVSSTGSSPSIGAAGLPQVSNPGFQITCDNGVPDRIGQVFYGDAAATIPFNMGILCAQPPLTRGPVFQFDNAGSVAVPISFTNLEIGNDQFWQIWFRDPTHPDGTGVGLSNALELTVGR